MYKIIFFLLLDTGNLTPINQLLIYSMNIGCDLVNVDMNINMSYFF